MDEKLSMMAKSTVFAGCSGRALLKLGALFEVVQLPPGSAVPAGFGWLHLVVSGQALAVEDGAASFLVGQGDVWRHPAGPISPGDRHSEGRLVALTALMVASVDCRAMGAVKRWSPEVAACLERRVGAGYPADPVVGNANDGAALVGSVSHG